MTIAEDPGAAAPGEPRPHRPTGASLIAVILVLAAFGAVMSLHLLRGEIHPVSRVMSDYANGDNGVVMTIAFYAFGVSAMALGFRLRGAIRRRGAMRPVPWLLMLSGLSLVAAGVFEVERAYVPDTVEEAIHSYATIAAFVMAITAMLLHAYGARSDPRWQRFAWKSWVLGGVAAAGAMAGPLSAGTSFSGAVQRVMGLAVLLWLLLAALHVRTPAFRTE